MEKTRNYGESFKGSKLLTRMYPTVEQAGTAYNVPHVFETTTDLVNSPDVDLVVVTVKVPQHKELVTEAINAGKHVFCEWPLGNGLEEAEEMAKLAKAKRVRGFVVCNRVLYRPLIIYATWLHRGTLVRCFLPP
jgi:predicted dehydrogenase